MRDATELETVRVAQAEAAAAIGLQDDLRRLLAGSHREVTAQVPVRMDDGRLRVLTAHRVQHNGARGPKGGIDLDPKELSPAERQRATRTPSSPASPSSWGARWEGWRRPAGGWRSWPGRPPARRAST